VARRECPRRWRTPQRPKDVDGLPPVSPSGLWPSFQDLAYTTQYRQRTMRRSQPAECAGRKEQLLMPPTQTLHGTARSQSLELERTEPVEPTTWRIGVLTDDDGHVHPGAIVADHTGEPCTFVDLLAAVRAASVAELDLARVLVL